MDTVRFAVVGCGSIANNYHIPALVRINEAEFVLACDIIEERANKTAERFDAESYCVDYQDVMKRDDIDLVCVFTKIEAHAEISIAAARAGKNIFVQKPFAHSIREGLSMVEAARSGGVQIAPSFMHRYFDECLAAAELIGEGKIGKVEFMRVRNGTRNLRSTAESYGGCLMDIGAHGIDLIRSLTGQEIAEVCANLGNGLTEAFYGQEEDPSGSVASLRRHSQKVNEPESQEERILLGKEVNAWMNYKLSSGTVVSHEVQWSQIGTVRFEAEIYGTEGTIFLRAPRTGEDLAYIRAADRGGEWIVPELPARPSGQAQHEILIRSILTGDGSAQTGDDGMAVLRVCEAARRSADSRCWVEVS